MATASTRSSVAHIVSIHALANGLAIIISNDYSKTSLDTLNGTKQDNENMTTAFKELKYAVISKHNVTYSEMMDLISSVIGFTHYPPSYKRVVFVFSGHGTGDYLLYTSDAATVSTEDILTQFSEADQFAKIPKLFFIDACRGSDTNPGRLVSKGGNNVGVIIPEGGSWLLAYSTLPKQKSFEVEKKGGVWMSRLAEKLRTDDSSINDILSLVNEEIMEFYYKHKTKHNLQQPEFRSRLNQRVFLLREAKKSQESTLPNDLDACDDTSQNQLQHPDQEDPVIHFHKQRGSQQLPGTHYCNNFTSCSAGLPVSQNDFNDTSHYMDQLKSLQQSNKICKLKFQDLRQTKNGLFLANVSFIETGSGLPKSFSSSTEKNTPNQAYEEAARIACKVIPKLEQPPIDHNQLQRLKEGCEARKPQLTYTLEEIQTNEHQRFQFRVTVKNSAGRVLCTEVGSMQGSKQLARHAAASKANTKLKF